MHSHTLSRQPKVRKIWRKVKRCSGLYQYVPSGVYHARVRHGGELHRESLDTTDLAFAKRKLRAFRDRLERTDPRKGKITLVTWLEKNYAPTLKVAPGALKAKQRIISRIKRTWFHGRTQPMRDIKKSQIEAWLNKHYGNWSESYWNSALSLIRDALEKAVDDGAIIENPARGLKYQKRKKPIRQTPTFEQFKAIVADIRGQTFNREAEDSGDFVELLGLAGLGQAEAASITRADVDLDAGRFIAYRHKTDTGFAVPIFPQLRPLMAKLCAGKKPHERLFKIKQARKAIAEACKRLGFICEVSNGRLVAQFTHRSLRRMFITRAIERGVDVKVLADWQGHRDGGKLILQTYSHVNPVHSNRMAQLMSDQEPSNVIPLTKARVDK
jgi:integrase